MKIIVYIIPTSTPVLQETLVKFFESNSLFRVEEVPGLVKSIGVDSQTEEANLIVNVLNHARKNYPDSYVITIKDTSTTTSNADILGALLIDAISFNEKIEITYSHSDSCESHNSCESCDLSRKYNSSDLYTLESSEEERITDTSDTDCYLNTKSYSHSPCNCKSSFDSIKLINNKKKHKWQVGYLADWLDRCDLFQKMSRSSDLIKWNKTFSPNGVQSIFWSPQGRDIILGKRPMNNGNFFTPIKFPLGQLLNENIEQGNINAIVTTPPFFYFDETLAETTIDLDKSCLCRQPDYEASNAGIATIIAIIIAVLIIALAWIVYVSWAKHY